MDDKPINEPVEERPRKLPRYTQDDLQVVTDEYGRNHYYTPEGRAVCGRFKKKKNRVIENEACLGVPMASGPCKVHGGKAGTRIRHGRYSRILKGWRGQFQQALNDRDLLDTRRDLAMMDVAIEQLASKAEEEDCPSWREDVRKAFADLNQAIHRRQQSRVGPLLRKLGDLIESGARTEQIAADLVARVETRANRAHRMNELEVRREEKVTASELAAVFGEFLAVLERNLDQQTYFRLVPMLRRATAVRSLPMPDGEPEGPPAAEPATAPHTPTSPP